MAYPLLPLLLSTMLQASATQLGMVEAVAEGTASLIPLISGRLADRWRQRKGLAIIGYLVTMVSRPLIAGADRITTVVLGRFLDRLGKGIRSAPKDALLADIATPDTRGQIIGLERAMDSTGAVLGPAISLLLLYQLKLDLRLVFLLTTIPALIAVGFFCFVPENKQLQVVKEKVVEEPEVNNSPQSVAETLAGTKLPQAFWGFIAVNAVFNLGNSSNTFLLLKAANVGLDTTAILLGYMIYNAIYAGVSYPAGVLSDRWGRRKVLLVGYAIFALVYAGFAQANTREEIWLLLAAYGFYPGITDGVSKAFAVDLAPKKLRATAIGIFAATLGVTRIIASLVGGWLWETYSSSWTFYYGALSAGLALILLWAIFRQLPTKLQTI
jgi:MFS family permease